MPNAENASKPMPEQALDQLIREHAFLLWEMEGRPEGRAEEYWHRARERVEAEGRSAYPPAQSGEYRT